MATSRAVSEKVDFRVYKSRYVVKLLTGILVLLDRLMESAIGDIILASG